MRRSRIVSAAIRQPTDVSDEERVETNLESVLDALATAERHDPDLVVFPEVTLQHRSSGPTEELACSVPGPETDAVGERAAAIGTNVILPMKLREEGAVYNAAVLLDTGGRVSGTYQKIRPTMGELESGTTPGAETPVWDTSIGRLGAAICYDLHFQEIAMGLARGHADIVAFPSMMAGDEMLRAWAINHGFHVVQCTPDETAVYTPAGERVAANDDRNVGMVTELSSGARARLGIAEINTDLAQVHLGTLRPDYEALMDAYGDQLAVDKCSTEAYAVVKSVGDVPLDTILEEFDMETKQEYIERARQAAVSERPAARIDSTPSQPTSRPEASD